MDRLLSVHRPTSGRLISRLKPISQDEAVSATSANGRLRAHSLIVRVAFYSVNGYG